MFLLASLLFDCLFIVWTAILEYIISKVLDLGEVDGTSVAVADDRRGGRVVV